ncbi:glycerophosphoryl diester phosphodiesterase membrane domain-containing protein [Demequina sp. NBRC 110054]|uniref:glycerophosphoryl diester phosphodiesterase membrane domain-containing protein n=1 Tax=Demequina sp. NBRC 110054 TaxID=1570343 RepID=UPI001356577D|nr:glycerophosphoryl diester phosphodiesterase membrane domain-containing protein [Demequina sp. NBRC 110054]
MSDSRDGSAGAQAPREGEDRPVFVPPSGFGAAPPPTEEGSTPAGPSQVFPPAPTPPGAAGSSPAPVGPGAGASMPTAPAQQHAGAYAAPLDAAAMLRPGIIPLRPLTFGELLDGPLKAIRHNPKVMVGVNALVSLASMILMYGLGFGYYGSLLAISDADAAYLSDGTFGASNLDIALLMLGSFLGALVLLISTGVTSLSFSRSVLGERISPGEALQRGVKALPALLAQSLLLTLGYSLIVAVVGIVIAGGFVVDTGLGILVLVLGVLGALVLIAWVTIKLALAVPAVVLERRGPISAMKRSWELTKGRFWMILAVLLVATLITSIIQQVITIPAAVILPLAMYTSSSAAVILYVVVMALMSFLGVLISVAYLGGVTAGLYTDQRMRQEAFDLVLSKSVQERAAAAGWGA